MYELCRCGVARVFYTENIFVPEGTSLYQILYVVASTLRFLIVMIQFLMMARAIISWLPFEEDHPIVTFLYTVTEPIVAPVRAVIERFGWFEGLPIDMSFFITFMLLSILEMFL